MLFRILLASSLISASLLCMQAHYELPADVRFEVTMAYINSAGKPIIETRTFGQGCRQAYLYAKAIKAREFRILRVTHSGRDSRL